MLTHSSQKSSSLLLPPLRAHLCLLPPAPLSHPQMVFLQFWGFYFFFQLCLLSLSDFTFHWLHLSQKPVTSATAIFQNCPHIFPTFYGCLKSHMSKTDLIIYAPLLSMTSPSFPEGSYPVSSLSVNDITSYSDIQMENSGPSLSLNKA